MNYYDSEKESTTPENGNSAGAVDEQRYYERIDFTSKDTLKDSDESVMIGVTKDGKKNEGFSPLIAGLTLTENIALSYVVATKAGDMVSGLIKKRYKKSGQFCYCLQLTDDPSAALNRKQFIQVVLATV